MIQLTCTSCKTVLSIDDAFAGGVCRCQHCGTIQTVPSAKGRAASPAAPKVVAPVVKEKPPQPRALYRTPAAKAAGTRAQTPEPARDLSDLAEAVQSSGLTGTGLRSGRLRKPEGGEEAAPTKSNSRLLIIAGATVAAIAVIVLIVLLMRGGGSGGPGGGASPGDSTASNTNGHSPGGTTDSGTSTSSPPTIDVKSPNFMGLPLKGPSVIYLLDRGSGTVESFDGIKGGTVKSLESLGKDLKFQVIFWEVREKVEASPESSVSYANTDNISRALETMRQVFADGASSIEHPLEKAIAQSPAEIVIVSGKSSLDDEFANTVLRIRGTNPVRIHTVCTGASGSPGPLRSIAEKAGGQFRQVDGALLKAFGEFSVN